MKERPIIMSGDSVRAILNGTKTQTRRIIKPQPWDGAEGYSLRPSGLWQPYDWPGGRGEKSPCGDAIRCPFGAVGDRLWVRETWADTSYAWEWGCEQDTVYKATDIEFPSPWRSPIYMPKRLARIWLAVTDVRVERLQEISEKDIQAEGIEPDMVDSGAADPNMGTGINIADYYEPFIHLWDSLNAKRGYGWDTNPWVFVVSFQTNPGKS